jgi:hypothetical protein
VITQVRQLITADPVEAHRKAGSLLRWASQVPFNDDELHNHQRFLLIEEVKNLRLKAALALQGHRPTPPTPPSPPPTSGGPKIIKFPRQS